MITDISKVNNNWIYQSNKLIEASYSFTVLEQKLIRLLASMIKKNDEDFKEYAFKATDLSKILNIHQKNIYKELDKITDRLMAKVIKIKNDEDEKFKKRHLIKKADFENGILTMKIDEEMKELYLKLNWYTKYELKNIMQFKSTYSFRMYELLKQYENIRSRVINIEDLRLALDINKDQYPKYANLKQKVITIAINEINTNTDLYIEFKEIKTGRKITSIKFYIKQSNRTINEIAIKSKEIETVPRQDLELVKQVQAIFNKHKITDREATAVLKDADNNIDFIKQCYKYLLTKDKINNVVGYMRKLVKCYNEPQCNIKVDSFNDYPQRNYDFKELEKKLLGWDNRTDAETGNNNTAL